MWEVEEANRIVCQPSRVPSFEDLYRSLWDSRSHDKFDNDTDTFDTFQSTKDLEALIKWRTQGEGHQGVRKRHMLEALIETRPKTQVVQLWWELHAVLGTRTQRPEGSAKIHSLYSLLANSS